MSVEKYLTPKQIAEELRNAHGLAITPRYIQAVRTECIRRGEKIFIARQARVSDVMKWLIENPGFRSNSIVRRRPGPGFISAM